VWWGLRSNALAAPHAAGRRSAAWRSTVFELSRKDRRCVGHRHTVPFPSARTAASWIRNRVRGSPSKVMPSAHLRLRTTGCLRSL
jgi:hypothetical protein